MRCRADNRLPWRLTAPLPAERAGVNAVRPVEAAAPHATLRHGANVIQHNAGGLCALSPVGNDGEPDPLRAARVRTIRIMSCAPAFSPVASATRSSSLLPSQRRRPSSAPQSPPSLAAPVPFCGGVIVGQPVVRGCRPGGLRLKDFMPARRRLAAAARAAQKGRASLVPASQATAARPGPCGHAKANPGQAVVPQSAVPSLADSLPPAPADPAPWPRHAAGGGLAAPRHGLPETDLVESGMTGSWRW